MEWEERPERPGVRVRERVSSGSKGLASHRKVRKAVYKFLVEKYNNSILFILNADISFEDMQTGLPACITHKNQLSWIDR